MLPSKSCGTNELAGFRCPLAILGGKNYVAEHGNQAEIFAAPAFNIIKDLVEAIPNPELTEDELMEKIDLDISSAPGKDLLSTTGSHDGVAIHRLPPHKPMGVPAKTSGSES